MLCPLHQLYGAVYCFFQPHFFHAALVIMPPMGALIFLAVGRIQLQVYWLPLQA